MTKLLLEAKTYSEDTEYPFSIYKIQDFENRYQEIIQEGYLSNPLKIHKKTQIPLD